jgi:uncharacterized protein YfaS (alpha-2-macroglobulin family)
VRDCLSDHRIRAFSSPCRKKGQTLKRHYEVFRDQHWSGANEHNLRVGDWVRVTLDMRVLEAMPHVALSDALPGALVAVDAEHDATVPVHALGELSESGDFYERQFQGGYARFYANQLYAGNYQVQYFAKVITHGRYQTLPAKVEAMYDSSRFATSGNQVFEVPLPQ